jgi:large subunit ribosomal protein L17
MLKNLLRGLFEHGQIETSEARAKETKRLADKMLGIASENTLTARRKLHETFGRRDVVNTMVDKIAPSMAGKKSGFTSIAKLAPRRGDGTVMYKLSLLVSEKTWTSFKKEKAAPEVNPETKSAAPAKEVAAVKPAAKKPAVKKAAKPATKAKTVKESK